MSLLAVSGSQCVLTVAVECKHCAKRNEELIGGRPAGVSTPQAHRCLKGDQSKLKDMSFVCACVIFPDA